MGLGYNPCAPNYLLWKRNCSACFATVILHQELAEAGLYMSGRRDFGDLNSSAGNSRSHLRHL